MKKGIIWVLLTCLMVMSLVLASCTKTTTTTTTPSTSATTTTSTSTTSTTPTATTATTAEVTTTTTSTGHWWERMGTPQYGGTLVTRMTNTITSWDPYLGAAPAFGGGRYMESPFCYDYTTDPLLGDFSTGYCPPEYRTGFMLTSFEMPDPTTFVEHFRTDIYWQNVYPANGRQFTSADVVFKYNRMLGFGGGYTTVDPFYAGTVTWQSLLSVTASDKYTVVFKWKTGTSPLLIQNTLTSGRVDTVFECPEAVAAYTTTANPAMTNWRNAVGTGPWFVSDFVTDSSVTYTANPSYWGRDLRYPQNRLPYVAEEKALIIASTATAEAAMRVGKIDAMSGVSVTDSQAMSKTNPEIIQKSQPQGFNNTVTIWALPCQRLPD